MDTSSEVEGTRVCCRVCCIVNRYSVNRVMSGVCVVWGEWCGVWGVGCECGVRVCVSVLFYTHTLKII